MYSLYRAWLMRDAMTAASLASPPDLIITVGQPSGEMQEEARPYAYQFVAHKHLVSLHSGYLKSLIQNESQGTGLPIANISLLNISPESFAPLLSFMYTGYLDLTNENIYSVLLATHLLHMPRALDICRAYLVQNQTELHSNPDYRPSLFPVQNNSNIIKPIPSRKFNSFSNYIWSPANIPPLMIHTRPDGPFQCVSPTEKTENVPEPSKISEPKSPLAIPSTSKTEEQLSVSLSRSPSFSSTSFTSDDRTVRLIKSPQRKLYKKRETIGKQAKKINNENLKVEYDVACCDGPVRFHRVLNESYGMSLDEIMEDSEMNKMDGNCDKITDKEYLENYPKTQFLKLKSTKNFSDFMHQQMLNSNLFRKSKTAKGVIQMRKVIEKEILTQEKLTVEDPSGSAPGNEKDDNGSDRSYTCVYCKHTFKSQYCYQKHAKRHINSAGEDGGGSNKNFVILRKVVSNTKVEGQKDGDGARREVRLLDMNVQYYPCKTCGSKFPSYYFVHKHRKLCHANEETVDETSNHSLENSDSSSSDHLVPQATTQ